MKTKFTVVTPSYNQLDWLRLNINSIADQVLTDLPKQTSDFSLEHLIQDAGTLGIEDFCENIANFFLKQYGATNIKNLTPNEILHLQVSTNYTLRIYKEPDEGMYDAINRGWSKATGDICSYLNCDEQYLPHTLDRVDSFFKKSCETDILLGAAIITDPSGEYLCGRKVLPPTKVHTLISHNLSVFTGSTFLKTKVVKSGPKFSKLWKAAGDAVWFLRLSDHQYKMKAISDYLSIHTDTGENLITSQLAIREQHRLSNLARHFQWLKAFIITIYRLRRFLNGAYCLRKHSYKIYTRESPVRRIRFHVIKPKFRWPGRG